MRVRARSTVEAPIEDVFAVLADPERADEWIDEIVGPQLLTPRPVGVGTQFRSGYALGGRVDDAVHEVTAFDPPRTIVYRSVSGPFPYGLRVDLAPVAGHEHDRTTVRVIVDAGADGLFTALAFALLGPLLRRLSVRQLESEIEALGVAATATPVAVETEPVAPPEAADADAAGSDRRIDPDL